MKTSLVAELVAPAKLSWQVAVTCGCYWLSRSVATSAWRCFLVEVFGNHLEETFGLVLEAEEAIQVEVKEVLDEAEVLDFANYKTSDGCSS